MDTATQDSLRHVVERFAAQARALAKTVRIDWQKEGYALLVTAHNLKAIARGAQRDDLVHFSHRLENLLRSLSIDHPSPRTLAPLERVFAHLNTYLSALPEVPETWLRQGEHVLNLWEQTLAQPLVTADTLTPLLQTLDQALKQQQVLVLGTPLEELAAFAQDRLAEPWLGLGQLTHQALVGNPPLLWPHIAGLVLADFYYAQELDSLGVLEEFQPSTELHRLAQPAPPAQQTVARPQLVALETNCARLVRDLQDYLLNHSLDQELMELAQKLRYLDYQICTLRSLPVEQWLASWPDALQSLGKRIGKLVQLDVAGGETLLDRALARELHAPLWHLLCNALDHGLELPEVRQAHAKPAIGHIKLSVHTEGSCLVWTVQDDGQGIDYQRVQEQAVSLGLVAPDQGLSSEDLLDLIFSPGLSTALALTEISGQGVGLNGVRRLIQELGGTITVTSTSGQGSIFAIAINGMLDESSTRPIS